MPESAADLQKEVQKLSLLYQSSQLFASTLDLDRLLQIVFDKLLTNLDAEAGSLWLLDDTRQSLSCHLARGTAQQKIEKGKLKLGVGIVGSVVQNKQAQIVEDAQSDSRFAKQIDAATGFHTVSMICCPLMTRTSCIGAIQMINKKQPEQRFTEEDLGLLNGLAKDATLAIINAQMHQADQVVQDQLDRLSLRYELVQLFNSVSDVDELLNLVFDRVILALGAEAGSFWMLDENGEYLGCHLARGPASRRIQGAKLTVGSGIVGAVVESKESRIVFDAQNDPNFAKQVDAATGFQTLSMICVPLVAEKQTIGAIQIINKLQTEDLFNEVDLEIAELIAADAASAIRNAQLHQAEKRVDELNALLAISHEITSGLDLDRILTTVVNMAAQVIRYDRCSVALHEDRNLKIAAISGEDTVNEKTPEIASLKQILSAIPQDYDKFSASPEDTDPPPEIAVAHQRAREHFESGEMKSLTAIVLKDEEGFLGILSFESTTPPVFSKGTLEVIDILVGQVTVSLRNAQLYRQVPLINVLEPLVAQRDKLLAVPARRLMAYAAGVAILVLGLVFIKTPQRVSGHAEILPAQIMSVTAEVDGLIDQVYKNEGSYVEKGDVVASLDKEDLKVRLHDIETQLAVTQQERIRLHGMSMIADALIAERQIEQLENERKLYQSKLEKADLRSPISGIILTPHLEKKTKEHVRPGTPFCTIADSRSMQVEVAIPEKQVGKFRSGADVQIRVPAYPTKTFRGIVERISPEARSDEEGNFFTVTARVTDADYSKLKPGMSGKAKIHGETQRLGQKIFQPLIEFIRMKFWI